MTYVTLPYVVTLHYIALRTFDILWLDYITYIHIHVAYVAFNCSASCPTPIYSRFGVQEPPNRIGWAPLGLAWNKKGNPGQTLSFKPNTKKKIPINASQCSGASQGWNIECVCTQKVSQKESWLVNIWAWGERNLIEHGLDWVIWISEYSIYDSWFHLKWWWKLNPWIHILCTIHMNPRCISHIQHINI